MRYDRMAVDTVTWLAEDGGYCYPCDGDNMNVTSEKGNEDEQ